MCSVLEPRRATVSCKNLFPSTTTDRSVPTSSSSSSVRRHTHNTNTVKRPHHTHQHSSRSGIHSSKQQVNSHLAHTNVAHVPFASESIHDNKHYKSLRTELNPLTPAFHSTRQPLLSFQSRFDLSHASWTKVPFLSETSDYGSGTDPDQQSVQQVSPQADCSPFKFDLDETSYAYSTDEHHPSSVRRTSLGSSSSSSSSSPTSPSSSISNLSSLSSSSEQQRSFHHLTRLTSKKLFSINNNNTTAPSTSHASKEMNTCYCDKENLPARKRNRPTTYVSRRSITQNHCDSCQLKRTKVTTARPKYVFNRQPPLRKARCYPTFDDLSSTRFAVDLTGLNIDYTIEYHASNKCTYSIPAPVAAVLPYYPTCSTINRCRCPPPYDWGSSPWTSAPMYNTSNSYHPEYYYPNANANPWISSSPLPAASTLLNYHDFYWTKFPNEHLSSIHFDDQLLRDVEDPQALPYHRHTMPVIEREPTQPPPTRSWLRLASPNNSQPTAIFTVMNYNILCDKYATRHVYGYCPSWALKWEYRRKQIFDELRSYAADIIALQEIETDQFHQYFLPELQKIGYDGVFSPKSRAKTMCEQDRRFVDGCAIFYRQSKFRLIKDYLVEFNQLAMSAAHGPACHDMMNRVMTKDNIGLVAVLETKEEIYSHAFANGSLPAENKQMLFVCTAHIHWDPEYCDVKVVQTLMLLSELKTIMEDAVQKHRAHSNTPIDCASVPLVLCGDFNSLPDSGVIELMRNGKISSNHADFKDLRYESFLQRISRNDTMTTPGDDIAHHFKLQSAYETTSSPIMPYTNYTYDFKGIIDYVFYSSQLMRVLGVLGPLDPEWLQTNKILGCPHPNVPSDHFSLLAEFEMNPISADHVNSKASPTRRQ